MQRTILAPQNPVQLIPQAPKKFKPIKAWAGLGVFILSIYAYSLTRYLVGGHAQASPEGSSPLPGYMKLSIAINDILLGVVGIAVLYIALWRPWRRERRLSLDGVVCIALITMWGQDPYINYFQPVFAYNAHLINLGCWQCFAPGWISPAQATFAESWTFAFFFYIGLAWVAAKGGILFFNWFKAKFPRVSPLGTFALFFVAFIAFDISLEGLWLRGGQYTYSAGGWGPSWLTLFQGHYYQFPVWEMLLGGLWFFAVTVTWYLRNDKGEILSERGIQEIHGSAKMRAGLRVLAAIGLFNAVGFVAYNVPVALGPGLHMNKWGQDTLDRSYYTQKFCGEGTATACPDPRYPIPNKASLRVGPDGKTLLPADGHRP